MPLAVVGEVAQQGVVEHRAPLLLNRLEFARDGTHLTDVAVAELGERVGRSRRAGVPQVVTGDHGAVGIEALQGSV